MSTHLGDSFDNVKCHQKEAKTDVQVIHKCHYGSFYLLGHCESINYTYI